jgi:MinD-like ATPase involved in chromosome partitioning or flagellar assembly
MSYRGQPRADVRRAAPPPVPPGRRVPPDWAPATVPQVTRAAAPSYRPPPQPPRRSPATPSATRIPPPTQRERLPGGTALDVLDDTEDPGGFSWRDLFWRVSRMDFGPGRGSAYEDELRDHIRTRVGSAVPIAVLNLKGGVGKTAVVEALGSTFADVRHDRVIAVDLDGGDLSDRHGRRSRRNMVDLLGDRSVTRYPDVRAHTFMNSSGLEVLGLPEYETTNWRVERHDIVKVFSILRKHYSMVLLDCVKSLKSGVMEAVLPESRALVVVTSTSIDAIRKTRIALDWLRNNGYQKLLASTVLAVNHTESSRPDTLACNELEQLSDQVAATVVLPFDRHIREGREIGLERMSMESRRSYLELAAAVVDRFPGNEPDREFAAAPGMRLQTR